jgi:hypothetical protein
VPESRGNFFSTKRAKRLAPIGNASLLIIMRVVDGAAADGAGVAETDKGARAACVAYTKIGAARMPYTKTF